MISEFYSRKPIIITYLLLFSYFISLFILRHNYFLIIFTRYKA